MNDLTIIIPARNEIFLARTIEDILENSEGDTKVIAILDGEWADPPVADNDRVTLIYHKKSVGQRAAVNEGVKLSRSKYVMKVDAHCAFDKGFDVKMMDKMQDNWTMVPIMKNLHAFNWVCKNGHKRYQGPSGPCKECGEPTERDVIWYPKPSPNSTSYRFDKTLHFQYWGAYKKKQKGETPETMSLQGSCFMCTRDKYIELDLCDETWGSWGNQGTEVACKTWLSGGEVRCNLTTWYAHMFRTQGGDFGFPYPQSGNKVEYAREQSRKAFLEGRWPGAKYPLSWLIEKFAPVPDWDDVPKSATRVNAGPSKGMVYYSDGELREDIAEGVRKRLKQISQDKEIPIVNASLKKLEFGDKDIYFPSLKRGVLTMFKQIMAGIENSTADIIFLCEHDMLYHPSHFDFIPPRKDRYYYNQNFWRVRMADGFAVHWDANQVSGLVADRDFLLKHYRERVKFIEENGFDGHYEPGGRNTKWTIGYKSKVPNVDIKHGENLSHDKWSPDDFRDKSTCINWQEGYEVPGWGDTKNLTSWIS